MQSISSSKEIYRSAFHFSPKENWINDPNGLVYFEGEYHLFYQYHPDSTVWGPMHWGHAVSTDLLHWQELPIALYPDELGTIFSGSAVIDWHNTAGFGEKAMIAIFTHDAPGLQQQSIAYSTDKGRTWTKYEGNPVLQPSSSELKDFRDPKVFWYGSKEDGHWVMSVSASKDLSILFFTSPNLIDWQASGQFGSQGATCGIWETPDLFELEVDDSGETRWVLTVGIGDFAPAGGSGQQYFIGQFDGQTFTNDNDKELALWADYGADFYAAQSWDSLGNRRLWIGWMNNWQYGHETPTGDFRGAMSLPRELSLSKTLEGIRLKQKPVREIKSLRQDATTWQNELISEGENLLKGIKAETFELSLDLELSHDLSSLGFKIRKSEEHETVLRFNAKDQQLCFDRSKSGNTTFSENYTLRHSSKISTHETNHLNLHIIVDKASIEVLAQDGLLVMSEQFFAPEDALGLELFVEGASVKVKDLKFWKLAT